MCDVAYSSGCVTTQQARFDGLGPTNDGPRRPPKTPFLFDVDRETPSAAGSGELSVYFPRQQGLSELRRLDQVTLVFYGRRAVVVRLPSGSVLQTDDYPGREAVFVGWLTATGIGWGVALLLSWRRPSSPSLLVLLCLDIGVAAMMSFPVLAWSESVRWAGAVAVAFAGGLPLLIVRARRAQPAR